jgi:hypothetical protein
MRNTILLILILAGIIVGCATKPPQEEMNFAPAREDGELGTHYTIVQNGQDHSSGHTSEWRISAEFKDGIVINGTFSSSYVGALGDKKACEGVYLMGSAREKCWRTTCTVNSLREESKNAVVTERIEPCDAHKILSEQDVSQEIESIPEELNPHLQEMFDTYNAKKGCNQYLCYENGQLVRYSPNFQLHWERENT